MNIVFDFDGTLVDSFEALYGLNHKVAEILFHRDLSREDYTLAFNGPLHKELPRILSLSSGEDKAFRAGKKYLFDALYSPATVGLHIDVAETLGKLDSYTFSILTAAPKEVVWQMLRHYHIDGFFSRVMSSEEHSKFEWLNSLSKPITFVTDTVGDVIEGKLAGVRVVGVSWGFHKASSLKGAGADVIIDKMSELVNHL